MKTPTSTTDKINISGTGKNASYTTVKGWHRIVCDDGAYIESSGIAIIGAPSTGRVSCIVPFEAGVSLTAYTASSSNSMILVRLLNGS